MDLLNFDFLAFEKFLFIFFRVGALILFVPILGSSQVPAMVKIGLVFSMSLAIFPVAGRLPQPEVKGLFELGVHLFSEVMVGLALAFAVRLFFTAAQVAGTVVDFQMGFGVVNVIDPQTQSQVSITAQFQNILAVLIFLAADAHHFVIGAVAESFSLINPQAIDLGTFTPQFMLQLFSNMFVIAVKLAAPIMAILFFLSVGLGLVARTVPQMNVFIVGFPLQIGVGLFMVGLSMSFFSLLMQNQLLEFPSRIMALLETL